MLRGGSNGASLAASTPRETDLSSLWRWQAGMASGGSGGVPGTPSLSARLASPALGYLVPARTPSAPTTPSHHYRSSPTSAMGASLHSATVGAKSRQAEEAAARQSAVKALRDEQRAAARAYGEEKLGGKRRRPLG